MSSNDEKNTELKRIEALTRDEWHIRKNALRWAGMYLQSAEDGIVEREVGDIEKDIQEDKELYAAYQTLIETIAKEVVKIGEELSEQAKQLIP